MIMSAFVRIYTRLGKENIRYIGSFAIHHEQFNSSADAVHIVEFIDEDKETVTEITSIVQSGQPCNIHIRFEDQDVESECTLDDCTVCETTNRILCSDPKIKLVRYNGN